ncbi:MAG: PTS sugar transporter subunit IIA [Neomegalonema sp.]|nr:PTS sugar transporter subunit IIA [Neomegalonema sp.]
MDLTDLITLDRIHPDLKASSKKQLLQELADNSASHAGIESRALFTALLERERLGSTGVGRGIAIPHCRSTEIEQIQGHLVRLVKPVDFDSIDGAPIDLAVLLIAPESAGSDHLKALARVSRVLRDPAICAKLRGAENAMAMHAIIADMQPSRAA